MAPTALRQQREERVEIRHPVGVDPEQAGLDSVQANRRLDDGAGEAHAAARRPELVGVVVGGERAAGAVGQAQHQRPDVGAEAPGGVMILAVDVGGDGPANGDVAGAGCHRHEPTLRHDLAQQAVEGGTGQDPGRAARVVELEQARHAGRADDQAPCVHCRVAVGPPQPAGDGSPGPGGLGGHRQLVGVGRAHDVRGRGGIAAPPGDDLDIVGGTVAHRGSAHAVYTPMAKTMAQATPMHCRVRSPRMMSSGAEPRSPLSSTSA